MKIFFNDINILENDINILEISFHILCRNEPRFE